MQDELKRLYEKLTTTDPSSREYEVILSNTERLLAIFDKLAPHCEAPAAPKATVEKPVEKKSETKDDPLPIEKAEAIEVAITKEEARTKLQEAATSGIQIQPIVAKFVPEGKPVKFSEIPASSYKALLEELKNYAG